MKCFRAEREPREEIYATACARLPQRDRSVKTYDGRAQNLLREPKKIRARSWKRPHPLA
jgi:hypothetical protein